MCGICGFVNRSGVEDGELLPRMVNEIRHRGPDDSGWFSNNGVGFGHTRLSILDLEGGRQPMCTPDQRFWITFNGEIFNFIELREHLIARGHQLRTRSDTEVILHLYQEEGEECVHRLNGQWAFAIWDACERKLFLSRDRFGVRPLFYTQTANRFLFGSEVKALLACAEVPRELDFETLDQIFTFWAPLPPRTAFRNIFQLPPGHSLTLKEGHLRIWEYWRLEFRNETEFAAGKEDALAEQCLDLLMDATRIRLRSDVPVAAYLSGGLDSTLIAALARQVAGERLQTFSLAFADPEFDERVYQLEASAMIGTQHSAVECGEADIARVFPEVVRHTEQPILRTAPAPLYLLAQRVRQSGFKVVLTGEGADEIFGGYDIFQETKVRRFWARDPDSRMRPKLLKRLYPYAPDLQRQPPEYLKNFFHLGESDLHSPFFSHLPRWEMTAKLKSFLAGDARAAIPVNSALLELESRLPAGFKNWEAFHQAEYLETAYLLPGYILSSQGDRMAMAHAVEGRYPFLDHRVVEFAAKLPSTLKMKVLDQKYLLKRVARGWIPESIRKRYKMPYRAPGGKSFFGAKDGYAEELLSPARVQRDGVFEPRGVSRLVNKFRSGRTCGTKENMALVGILSTEILLDKFMRPRIISDSREGINDYEIRCQSPELHHGELSFRGECSTHG